MEKNTEVNNDMLSSTDLAFERTVLAYERTLMAWVRTSISMISFGFTIYKFFEETGRTEAGQHRLMTPRIVGMIMIGFGLLSLILAQVQHQVAIRKLKLSYPAVQKSLSTIIGILVLLFGLTLFFGALFRQ